MCFCGGWQSRHTQNVIRVLVVLGVGMIMGDGVLTPAISVVSACEGLQQASSSITRSESLVIINYKWLCTIVSSGLQYSMCIRSASYSTDEALRT